MTATEAPPKPAVDWDAIKARYQSTKVTLQDLAAEFGVSYSGIMKRSAREHWKGHNKVIRNTARKVAARATDTMRKAMVLAAEREGERAVASVAEYLADSLAKGRFLADTAIQRVKCAMPDGVYVGDVAELGTLANVAKVGVDMGRKALGLDQEGAQKPTLVLVGKMSSLMGSKSDIVDIEPLPIEPKAR